LKFTKLKSIVPETLLQQLSGIEADLEFSSDQSLHNSRVEVEGRAFYKGNISTVNVNSFKESSSQGYHSFTLVMTMRRCFQPEIKITSLFHSVIVCMICKLAIANSLKQQNKHFRCNRRAINRISSEIRIQMSLEIIP